jgi:iron complex transport system ATP-binding protein
MSALLFLTDVSVRLRDRLAVREVSFAISAGEIVALLGPNGAGKTTLMRAALGLLDRDGAISLNGDDPRLLNARDRALRAAYLPQRPQSIWPISVESLVGLGRFAHGAAPDRLVAPDQVAVDVALEACGLDSLRTRRMDEISGGEKARAHLARALAQHAPLLVLDEPTAGLDPAQALAVAEVLRKHAEGGGAVLFSTHDVGLAVGAAHRVVLMKQGGVIAQGAPQTALTPDALKAAYGREGRVEWLGDQYAVVFR